MTMNDQPGHGPADPPGYLITEAPGGYVWTRLADGHVSEPYPGREDAVHAAEADAGA